MEILNVYDNTTYVGIVHAKDFIKHLYGEIDVHGYVPTFAVHRKLYYDWVGNARIGRTVAKALRTEKKPWKLLLKKMVEHDAVDCLKIREVLPNTVPDQQLLEFGRVYRVKWLDGTIQAQSAAAAASRSARSARSDTGTDSNPEGVSALTPTATKGSAKTKSSQNEIKALKLALELANSEARRQKEGREADRIIAELRLEVE